MKISKPLIWTFIISIMITTFSTQIFAASEKELEYNPVEDINFFMGLDEEGNIINMYTEDLEQEVAIGAPMALNDEEDQFVAYDKSADKVLETFDNQKDADAYLATRKTNQNIIVYNNNVTHNLNYGVVNFRIKGIRSNTNFIEEKTGFSRYTNGQYGADAVFLGYASDGKVRFKLAGVVGVVEKDQVQLVEYSDTKIISKYYTVDDRIYHGIVNDINATKYASQQDVGVKPSYLQNGKNYYSYDGHYFYETFHKMADDYKNGTYANAVNSKNPYYNYYQFLSHRSESSITAEQIDKYFKDSNNTGEKSKLHGTGKALKEAEAKYGINALLIIGVAINESAWGNSRYAIERNNLFGHGAVDSNPDSAVKYASSGDSIIAHASKYLSDGYLDPCDWTVANDGYSNRCTGGRYNGGHLGDKRSGSNVMYASDPYWGEKAASQVNRIEKDGYTKEKREQIGVLLDSSNLNVRKEADTKSTLLYRTRPGDSISFKILGTVKGEMVEGSDVWYKIQSDPVLDKTRSKLLQNTSTQINEYDMKNMYGYIHASYVHIIDKEIVPPTKPSRTLGDVNNDGKINALDYVAIKNHMLGKKLTGDNFTAADITKDGKVNALDYIRIKNHMLGRKPGITQ